MNCYVLSGWIGWHGNYISVSQFSSVAQSCPTLYDTMDCSTPGLPVHRQHPEFTQTHVHWVSDAIQLPHPLSSPSPPNFNLSQHEGLFKSASSSQKVAKVLEFQLQHQSFQRIISVSSVSQSCPTVTPWTTAHQASLFFTDSQSLPKLISIELVMPPNYLILCCPLLLPSIFPSIWVFSSELALHIRWPKYWSFSFSISPSNEYSGLISFRMDWLDLLAVQEGLSRVFSNITVQQHQFFGTHLPL